MNIKMIAAVYYLKFSCYSTLNHSIQFILAIIRINRMYVKIVHKKPPLKKQYPQCRNPSNSRPLVCRWVFCSPVLKSCNQAFHPQKNSELPYSKCRLNYLDLEHHRYSLINYTFILGIIQTINL